MEETKSNKAKYIGIAVLFIATAVGGYYTYKNETNGLPDLANNNNATTTITQNGITIEIPPGGSVQVLPGSDIDLSKIGPSPDLKRMVVFPADYPSDAKTIFQNKLRDLKTAIASNPTSVETWIEIGLLYSSISDYEGARVVWEYAKKIDPKYSITYGNLGFLYGFHLKDNAKAEENFRNAISLAPTQLYLFEQLFSFYRDVLKSPAKARALAEQGQKTAGNKAFFDSLLATL